MNLYNVTCYGHYDVKIVDVQYHLEVQIYFFLIS